ncbi:hypothetical protein [Parafilimonas sp.]|uniref:hypothetical protein n=1 Tax=Parafilimonas sp. TaxID=1969739 RepID=UPI0039E23365
MIISREEKILEMAARDIEARRLSGNYEYCYVPGTVGEVAWLVERWNKPIAESEYTIEAYNDLVKGFNSENIEILIDDTIINVKAKGGYTYKGFMLYPDWKTTLRDFILYEDETLTPEVHVSVHKIFFSRDRTDKDFLVSALKARDKFKIVCKGFAIAKYIDFLKVEAEKLKQPTKAANKINAPVIATFCYLLNEIGTMPKGNKSIADYCQEVCKEYNLPYTDKVRQNYNSNPTKKNTEKVVRLILPVISAKEKNDINQYLNNKYTPKQNLYA